MERLSKLSKPVKIGGGAGIALILLLLAFTILRPHSKATTAVTAAPKAAVTPKADSAKQALQLTPGLPPALRAALRDHTVVVAVLASGGDGDLVSTARQGAKTAHAGFAVLDVGDETVARAVAMLVPGVGGSGVLVFRRPGTVSEALPSYTDADTVAQAAIDSKTAPTTTTMPAATIPTPSTTPGTTAAP